MEPDAAKTRGLLLLTSASAGRIPPQSSRRRRWRRIGNAVVSHAHPQSMSAQGRGNEVPRGVIHVPAVGSKSAGDHRMQAQLLANSVIAGQICGSSRIPNRRVGRRVCNELPACRPGLGWPIAKNTRCVPKKVLTRRRRMFRLWDVGVDEGESCGRESVPRQEHSLFLFLCRSCPSSCIHS